MPSIKVAKLLLNFLTALILPVVLSAQQADEPPAKPSPTMESHIGDLTGHSAAGADLYYRYCWGCHGARGNGDGENAPWISPQPRNFIPATFKCRSTPTGTCLSTPTSTIPSRGALSPPTCPVGPRSPRRTAPI